MSQALTTNEIRSDINSESNVNDPKVGMTFPSWDAVDSYYHAYGKQRGFGVVRAAMSYKQKGGTITREKREGIWRCDCCGKPDKRRVSKGKHVVVQSPIKKSLTNRTNSSKKCKCPAMVYAKPNECNELELCTVVLEHKNHTPTRSKSRHIPKYRNEELNKCNVARNLFNANAAGVSIAKIHRTLVMERNGLENLVWANEEKEADTNCWKYTRTLLTAFPFEAQFRVVYTDAKFKEVQVQCSRVLYVTPLEKRVVASHDSGCECKHFECYGIMCRHLIKVYYMYNVEHVPSKFILRCWRKDIQRKHMVVKVAYHDLSKTTQVQRFDKLMVEFERVCLNASLLDVNIHTCMELIQLMDLRVEENNTKFYESARAGQGSTMCTQNETASTSKGTTSHSVVDPVLCRKKKGSKGGVRLQSAAEKAMNKKKMSSTTNDQAEVNETGLPMFGVGYRSGVVAQRLFVDDPPLVQPLRQLCPTEPLFGCQLTNGNHQWFPY
ncbi:Protein FAR1-RELATED SEQUENCE 2 [Bienertia sinuspersici]